MKLWLAFSACVGAFFGAAALGHRSLELAAKPLPVLVLASGLVLLSRSPLRRGVAVGLLASALGDVLLGLDLFVPGLLAFLGAHVAYLAAFLGDQKKPAVVRALPFAAWGILLFIRLWPALGNLALPVAFYVLAICAMMWRAAARVGRGSGPGAIAGLLGAICFGISDSVLAWDRFLAGGGGAVLPVMLFYWLGQAGIARAALDEESR
jgi:alkenylglycerophosphocholine/alkenylglycerophosphoethanolamine hydrolase